MFILRLLTQGDPAYEIFSVLNKNEEKGKSHTDLCVTSSNLR